MSSNACVNLMVQVIHPFTNGPLSKYTVHCVQIGPFLHFSADAQQDSVPVKCLESDRQRHSRLPLTFPHYAARPHLVEQSQRYSPSGHRSRARIARPSFYIYAVDWSKHEVERIVSGSFLPYKL